MKTLSSLWLISALALAQSPARYRIDAFAGTSAMGDNGPATSAILDEVRSVVADSRGGFYLGGLFRIRYVNAQGVIRTVMGLGYGGSPQDGLLAADNTINAVSDLKLSPNGELYFVDGFSCVVGRIDADGIVRIVAGIISGIGAADCGFSGDGGAANRAKLNVPTGLAFDAQGRLLIADQYNGRIRRVDLAGNIETIAGNGDLTSFAPVGLAAKQTAISYPTSVAAAADGTVYFTEYGYRRIRRISPEGLVANVAGTGFVGNTGDGGPATDARFDAVDRLALDAPRNRLFVADSRNNRVRVISFGTGLISHAAGITFSSAIKLVDSFSGDGGPATAAGLAAPKGIAVDAAGALFIADSLNYRVRKADTGGIRTLAGRFRNTADGPAIQAELNLVDGIAIDPDGNLVIADRANRVIRRVVRGNIATIAGTPPDRWPANLGFGSSGDAGPALSARFNAPRYLAVDATGRILVNDDGRLRRIDGPAIGFLVNAPAGAAAMAIDGPRNLLYLVVPTTHKVLVADLAQATPVFRDFAGSSTRGFAGDGAAAASARLDSPSDVAVDVAGNVYIADTGNNRVRKVTGGIIATIIGNGNARGRASTVQADAVALSEAISPIALTVDSRNRVTIGEGYALVVRQFDPTTLRLSVIAGTIGRIGLAGDGGLATGAQLTYVNLVRSDAAGNIYVSDGITSHIRSLRPVTLSRFEAVSGNAQSGPVATKLAAPLVVRVATADGPLSGVSVAFAAVGATVAPASAITGIDGTARVEVTLGATAGPASITASLAGLPAVTFTATAVLANTPVRLEIVSGNLQSGSPGQLLAEPLRVRVMGRLEVGVAGVPVNFTMASGDATLSAAVAVTNAEGLASIMATLGAIPGTVVIRASVTGLAPVDFTLTSSPGVGGKLPEIVSILGAGLSTPAVRDVSVNGLVQLSGRFFASDKTDSAGLPTEGILPVILAGVCVEFGAARAPLLRVTPQELAIVVPEIAGPEVDVTVITGCDTPSPARSAPVKVSVKAATPEWFYRTRGEDGRNPIRAANEAGVETVAAKPGEIISAFGTGFGQTEPLTIPGAVINSTVPLVGQVVIEIGDRTLPAESNLYVGLTPGSPGLYQATFRVPLDLEDGNHQVTLRIGDARTPPGGYISVRKE